MCWKEYLIGFLILLPCASSNAQGSNPLMVFEEIPHYARLLSTAKTDSVEIIYRGFQKKYPLLSYYQVNGLIDQVRLEASGRLKDIDPKAALEVASQIDDNKLRWKELELFNFSEFTKEEIEETKLNIVKLQWQIPGYKELGENQYADLLFFSEGPQSTSRFVNEKGWQTANFKKSPLLSAHIWDAFGDTKKAVDLLANWVRQGNADQFIKDKLAFFYNKLPDNTYSYERFEEDLLRELQNEKLKDKSKYEVNFAAPDFRLKNLKGESVTLEVLKGKVVVLDFWATWCKPCLAAFPAMQSVKDRYRDNPNVIFLFVNTMERKKDETVRRDQISKLLKDRNLSFNVLIDEESKSGYEMASKYQVSGLPTQFILDQNAQVKYKLMGFDGHVDVLVEEVSALINSLLVGNN